MDEVKIADVYYRKAYQQQGTELKPCWSRQYDDSLYCGVFDVKKLIERGFLTDQCDCEIVLRKK